MPSAPPHRVLVTRSRHQASALADHLRRLGVHPILIPTIAIAPPRSYAPLDDALTHLTHFDWLLFTSANAVEAFAQRRDQPSPGGPPASPAEPLLKPQTAPQAEPQTAPQTGLSPDLTISGGKPCPRVAAIGPSTAHALAAIGLTPDLLPPLAVAESLARTLLPHIHPGRTRILLVRAETARDTLPDALRAAGATLTVAPAYRNLVPESSMPLLRSLFASPSTWPDAITFTSSSTAANLLNLLEAAGLTLPTDGAEGKTILRASIGPITSQTLRDLGYPPHLEAPEPTTSALAETLARHLHLPHP